MAARDLVRYALTLLGILLVYPLSKLIPRDRLLWVFGAPNGRFEGNAKYLFLWLNQEGHRPAPVWVTSNASLAARLRQSGFQAYRSSSLRGLFSAARGGVTFVNDNTSDVHFSLCNGTTVFNLWHGVGLKNVLHGTKVGSSARLRRRSPNFLQRVRSIRRLQRPDWVLSTSPEMSESFFARCFGLRPERAPALGYPRLDPHVDRRLQETALALEDYSALDTREGQRLILYAPTLRESGADFLGQALPDLRRLSNALSRQDALLFVKLHPKMAAGNRVTRPLPANIALLPDEMDLYPVLEKFDALVTDYSSLFFDYIALKAAGVLLYTFDFAAYTSVERDLAWDYDQATLGVRAHSFSDLCGAIADGRIFAALDPQRVQHLRERFWGGDLQLPTASERIRAFVLEQHRP